MKNVLIVEDSSIMTYFIKTLIERNGFKVIGIAENGIKGAYMYKELQPDIVTMDITMPEMDGIESLKHIMKLDPKAKVLIISSISQQHVIEEAILNGAKGYIMKLFSPDTLVSSLKRISACSSCKTFLHLYEFIKGGRLDDGGL